MSKYLANRMKQPIPKLRIRTFADFLNKILFLDFGLIEDIMGLKLETTGLELLRGDCMAIKINKLVTVHIFFFLSKKRY